MSRTASWPSPEPPRLARLGVEATHLLRDNRGIGRYVRNVLRGIAALRPALRVTLYVRRGEDVARAADLLADIDGPLAERSGVEAVGALRSSRDDLVWYPWNKVSPLARGPAIVVTIHDVASMLQLDRRWWKVLKRVRYRVRYARAVRRADLVVAVSEFTAEEIRGRLGVNGANLRVVHNGSDDLPSPSNADGPLLERLGVGGPFFLAVGATEGRKNLRTLHGAMALLHSRGRTVPLVQCGPRDPNARLPFVKYAGFVEDGVLASLYRHAAAVVVPSRYEGFGLPAAEAMAAGGGVVCSSAGALREVVGEAGLYFPWDGTEALAARLEQVLDDEALGVRLRRAGAERASHFRWAETARRTLDVFEEALALRRARAGVSGP